MARASNANTPIGANIITILTSFITTAPMSSTMAFTRCPASPASRIAAPKRTENTMIWSMFMVAKACTGLVGTMAMICSSNGGGGVGGVKATPV